MRILINHLTRMHGARICLAGVDLQTRRHVRPMLGPEAVPFYLLARYGGPFDMARIVDLGSPRPAPEPPHVEDHVFVASRAKFERAAAAHEFWRLLDDLRGPSLREIFGEDLRDVGRSRYVTPLGLGTTSLGCLRPVGPPELYLTPGRDGKQQIRMKFSDGRLNVDAGVTDLRLFNDDHATADAARVRAVAQRIADGQDVILSVGLTRKFRAADDAPYFHWLQVNNIHLKEDPVWQLG